VTTAPTARTTPAAKAPAGSSAARARKAPATKATLVVREDESPWTAKELRAVRSELEHDIEQLRSEVAHAQSDLVDLMRDSGDGAGDDQADAGAKTYEREQEISLANNAREMLEQNEHALERLDNGTYGICESCGNPIGKLRLQAAPRATLCMPCKMKQERR
jgi:RNA polymerase-binding protein DksA